MASPSQLKMDFPGGSDSKESACNAGDPGSIPGLGRCPAEGNNNPVEPCGLQSMGSQRIECDLATHTHTCSQLRRCSTHCTAEKVRSTSINLRTLFCFSWLILVPSRNPILHGSHFLIG